MTLNCIRWLAVLFSVPSIEMRLKNDLLPRFWYNDGGETFNHFAESVHVSNNRRCKSNAIRRLLPLLYTCNIFHRNCCFHS